MSDCNKYKFFKNPCFACAHMITEYGDSEYSSYSWEECGRQFAYNREEYKENEEYLFEIWSQNKKGFPFVEAPKKCIRLNYWKLDKDFNFNFTGDYYDILASMHDFESDIASYIAGSIANFNFRMRNANGIAILH